MLTKSQTFIINAKKKVIHTLTRCPRANANAFCTTLLLSWMPFSRALISLPANKQIDTTPPSTVHRRHSMNVLQVQIMTCAVPEYGVRS